MRSRTDGRGHDDRHARQPGVGVAIAVVAFLAAALLVLRPFD